MTDVTTNKQVMELFAQAVQGPQHNTSTLSAEQIDRNRLADQAQKNADKLVGKFSISPANQVSAAILSAFDIKELPAEHSLTKAIKNGERILTIPWVLDPEEGRKFVTALNEAGVPAVLASYPATGRAKRGTHYHDIVIPEKEFDKIEGMISGFRQQEGNRTAPGSVTPKECTMAKLSVNLPACVSGGGNAGHDAKTPNAPAAAGNAKTPN